MWKPPFLPNGALVIDLPDSPGECIVKGNFPDHNPPLFRLLGFGSCIVPNLPGPPVFKCGDLQDSHVVPFHLISVLRSSFRQFLHERKEVNPHPGFTQFAKHRFRIVQKLVAIRVEVRSSAQSPLDLNFPAANVHAWYPWLHPFRDFKLKEIPAPSAPSPADPADRARSTRPPARQLELAALICAAQVRASFNPLITGRGHGREVRM